MGLNKVIQACEPAKFAKMPLKLVFESARSTLVSIFSLLDVGGNNCYTVHCFARFKDTVVSGALRLEN
jgi:hypothetical protein